MKCWRCDTRMVTGVAMMPTYIGVPDFGDDERGVTLSPGGPGVLVDCWKCPWCGHSVTRATGE